MMNEKIAKLKSYSIYSLSATSIADHSVDPEEEASVVQWLCHSPYKPGVAGSIPGFSSPSDGTINRGPVSI